MVDVSDKIIAEKIRYQQVTWANAAADVFSAAVGQAQKRYVFQILLSNDESDPQRITIQHRDTSDSDTAFIDSVVVDGDGTLQFGGWNPMHPIIVLGSDEQLRINVDTAAKTGEATFWYWDEDLN